MLNLDEVQEIQKRAAKELPAAYSDIKEVIIVYDKKDGYVLKMNLRKKSKAVLPKKFEGVKLKSEVVGQPVLKYPF